MDNHQKKILEMLAAGKISVAEAERLFSLMQDGPAFENTPLKKAPKYLRVIVTPRSGNADPAQCENVNIRVPMALLRAGIKLAAIIPPSAYNDVDSALKDKGIKVDLRDIKPENLEEIIAALADLEVNVDDRQNQVRIYAE